jgi:hypothetical protein
MRMARSGCTRSSAMMASGSANDVTASLEGDAVLLPVAAFLLGIPDVAHAHKCNTLPFDRHPKGHPRLRLAERRTSARALRALVEARTRQRGGGGWLGSTLRLSRPNQRCPGANGRARVPLRTAGEDGRQHPIARKSVRGFQGAPFSDLRHRVPSIPLPARSLRELWEASRDVKPPERGDRKAKQFLYPSEFLKFVSCEDVPIRRRRAVAIAVYTFVRDGEL